MNILVDFCKKRGAKLVTIPFPRNNDVSTFLRKYDRLQKTARKRVLQTES